jgi:beta-xylosidase
MERDRRMTRPLLATVALVCAAVLAACGPELGPVAKLRSIPAPRLPETSDPSVVREGAEYFIYGSNSHVRAPVTRTTDPFRVYSLADKNARTTNAMPTQAPWAVSRTQHWAPTVARFYNTWVMFFSADRASGFVGGNRQCIGRATSSSPVGPFTPGPRPVHCGINHTGGALDPQIFRDPSGRWWLHAAFGNTESPIHAMPLDGHGNISGPARPILSRRHAWEYHFIENPAMLYDPGRRSYVLAYSAGKWWEARYSTGIARCSAPDGPCTSDPSGPWIASSNGRTGPGGLSFFTNTRGVPHAIFSTFPAGGETTNGNRSATIMSVGLQPAVGLGAATR